jgi:hypothetical protein
MAVDSSLIVYYDVHINNPVNTFFMSDSIHKSFSEMSQAEFKSSYVKSVNRNDSYVGGAGGIEHGLWEQVQLHQKWAKQNDVELPVYESIECTQEDWI